MSGKFTLGVMDYVIICIMLAISIAIGLYFRIFGGAQKTTEDYLLAGRNMAILPVAFSLMATFMSATTLMGIPAEMYLFGTHMAFMNIGFLLGPIIANYVFLPIYFENIVSTPYEYLEKRFGPSTRKILSIMFLFQNVLFNGVVLYAPSLALSAVTNLSIWTSVISIGVVCTFYCTVGGIKAVMWTDVFQSFLMYICLVAIAVIGIRDLGGFSKVFSAAYDEGRIVWPTFELDFSTRYTMYSVLLMGIIITLQCYGCSQIQIQRQLSIKKLKSAQIASLVSAPMLVVFQLLCCLCGLIFYVYFKDCDPVTSLDHPIQSADQLMPYFITSSMGYYPGLPGLCIAGIFSASLSTISSGVNSMAAVTYEDIIKPLWPKLSGSVFITNTASVFYGALSIFITFLISSMGNLIKATVLVVGVVCGPSLGVFLLAAFTTTATEMGTNMGIIIGFLVGICLTFVPSARKYPILPVGENCSAPVKNMLNSTYFEDVLVTRQITLLNETNYSAATQAPSNFEDNFPVSYMWISPLSMLITIVFGYIGSLITQYFKGKPNNVPVTLLCPARRACLPKSSKEKVQATDVFAVSKM